jgi:YVTN family beta-propeller protein
LHFGGTAAQTVTVHAALSWVGYDGALANLRSGNVGFDWQRARVQGLWRNLLGEIRIEGGSAAQQRTFYTALYHSLLHPDLASDADGRYRGFDGGVHRVRPGHQEYQTFSGWDIYRTQMPLAALLAPAAASDMMQSLVDDAAQGGWLPKWPLANAYTGVMGGDSADPILAGAYAFGARSFDTGHALHAMIKNAEDTTSPPGQGWYRPRPGGADFNANGYVPNDVQTNVSPVSNGASLTLEYALDDFSIAQFARALGDEHVYRDYAVRAQQWRTLFDTSLGEIAPRDVIGAFMHTAITESGQSGFQEGNAAQYTWMVPEDYAALIAGLGGDSGAVRALDSFFSQLNAGPGQPYAWLGNEPSLGSPWTYLSAADPSGEERVVHDALATLYADAPDGIPGNDDLGTMSAWYVWCALGLYPQNPATGVLDLGTPLFSRETIAVPHGAQIILTSNASAGAEFVQNLRVNGRAQTATYVPLSLARPMTIEYRLSSAPTHWGAAAGDAPPSYGVTPPAFPASTAATYASADANVDLSGGKASAGAVVDDPGGDALTFRADVAPGAPIDAAVRVERASAHRENVTVTLTARAGSALSYYPITVLGYASNGALLEPWTIAARTARTDTLVPLAYVASYSDDTVTAFYPSNGTVVATIPVGKNPGDVALSPNGARAYVPNQSSGNVSVIDTSTFKVTATVKVGKIPASIHITGDGATAWVTNYGDGTVQPIDLKTLRAGTAIPVGRGPEEAAFSPDGRMLYVANQNDNTITPVDVAARKALPAIAGGARPFAIAIPRGGSTMYVSDQGTGTILPIDLATGRPEAPIVVGVQPQGLALDPSGGYLYAADSGSDTVSLVDLARARSIDTIRVGLNPFSVAVGDGGRSLYATLMGEAAVVKVSLTQPNARPLLIPAGGTPQGIALP